jgi:hypothetical protein
MAEMIIPGTYISVRPEGLISAGRIATGVIGIVGTASSGPVDEAKTLSSFAEAREIFGTPDAYDQPVDGSNPLTLVRALEHVYSNGGTSVIAVRVADNSQSIANFAVTSDTGNTVATLSANTSGTWGNDIYIETASAAENCRIVNEEHDTSTIQLNYSPVVPSLENRIRLYRGQTRQTSSLNILYRPVIQNEQVIPTVDGQFFLANTPIEPVGAVNSIRVLDGSGTVIRRYGDGAIVYGDGVAPETDEIRITTAGELIFAAGQAPQTEEQVSADYAVGFDGTLQPGQVLLTTWNGELEFAAGEGPQPQDGDRLFATYLVDQSSCIEVRLSYGETVETYIVPDGLILANSINAGSVFARAEAEETNGGNTPSNDIGAYFGTGSNTPGGNGAGAGSTEYTLGLERLSNKLVNIVVLAGQDASTMGSVLLSHLNATEQIDYERIGVIGVAGSTMPEFLGHNMADDRVILVAPGLIDSAGTTLPAAYTAAAVAGVISSLPVQTSLTNKTVNIRNVSFEFNRGQQEQLIKRNVLVIVEKIGFRILKGITTEGEGAPYSAIPTRRIVDYAKYGVRSAAAPYLGRLNNERVRSAMKATLDAFLTRMVEDEALTGYELAVSATRPQEIAGEVSVVMTLQPTFSIEFIRVTMILK